MRSRRSSLPTDIAVETIPPVVLRKYFSSLERLRLAEDGKTASRPPSRLSLYRSIDTTAAAQTRDTLAIVTGSVIQPGSSLSRRLGKRRTTAAVITPETLDWFASLSPAAQKKLFSHEECALYAQEKTTFILDAADRTLRRRSWQPLQSSHPTSEDEDFSEDEDYTEDEDSIVDSEEHKVKERVDSAIGMGDYSLDGFRWLDDEGDLDLKLDDYHQAIVDTNRRTMSISEPVRRRSRRAPSLSSLSLRLSRPSTSSARPPLDIPPTPALPIQTPHSRSSSFTTKNLRPSASRSSIDPSATHYQDPAARMKLRLYLASPQKFDEAVEFGFPSVESRHARTIARPMTSPQPRPEVNRTFFHDDTPELSGDDDDDDEPEDPDLSFDPRTPEDPVFNMHRVSRKGSLDIFAKARPFSSRRPVETFTRGLSSEREMTLHMTLTRPDLREGQLLQHNTQKVNRTPLEKAELPVEASPVSIWDMLPPEESKVRRFFRRLRLK